MVWTSEGVSKAGYRKYVEGAGVWQVAGDANGRIKVPSKGGHLWVDETLSAIDRDAVRDLVVIKPTAESSVDKFHWT